MIEAMQKEMDAESAADEKLLRERVLATGQLHKKLLDEYIEKFGAPPMAVNLSANVEGAQFCAGVEDAQDRIALHRADDEGMQSLASETYDQRDPNADLHQTSGSFVAYEEQAARENFENNDDPFAAT